MKAQVLTTTRSASAAERAGTSPSPSREAATLSESTAFFGQPSVSIQKRSPEPPAATLERAAAAPNEEPPLNTEDAMTRLAYRWYLSSRGGDMSVPSVWCPACGAEYTVGSRYCNDCRVELVVEPPPSANAGSGFSDTGD